MIDNQTESAEKRKWLKAKESERRKVCKKLVGDAEKFPFYGMPDKELLAELTRPNRERDEALCEAVRRIYEFIISFPK